MLKIINTKTIIVLLAMTLLSAGAYGYLLQLTVSTVIERRQVEAGISDLAVRLVELEGRYLAADNSITLDRARSLGFALIPEPHFAKLGYDGLTLADLPTEF